MIIAGYGFVGKAHELLFKNFFEIDIHDPPLDKQADFSSADCVVICVSTPELQSGACDIGAVYDVITRCKETTPILIKSTIHLQGWQYLKETFPNHRLCFSPEFLRAATAIEDVLATSYVIIAEGDSDFWSSIYTKAFPKVVIYNIVCGIQFKAQNMRLTKKVIKLLAAKACLVGNTFKPKKLTIKIPNKHNMPYHPPT